MKPEVRQFVGDASVYHTSISFAAEFRALRVEVRKKMATDAGNNAMTNAELAEDLAV